MTSASSSIDELLAILPTLEYEELVRMSRAGERQMGDRAATGSEAWSITYGAAQEEFLRKQPDDEQKELERVREKARAELARRLRAFPRLRGDTAAKVGLNAALDNVVFGMVFEDRLTDNEHTLLLRPWAELLRGRGASAG